MRGFEIFYLWILEIDYRNQESLRAKKIVGLSDL